MFAVFGSRSLLGLLALVTLQQSVAVALNNDAAVYLKGESIRGGLSLDAEGAEQVTTIPAEHLSSILERLSLTEVSRPIKTNYLYVILIYGTHCGIDPRFR